MLQLGTALVVAVAYAAIAFADGGFSRELIAVGSIVIWWIVVIGILARWWRGGQSIPRDAVLTGVILALLGAWTALSMLWADDAGRAFTEVVRVMAYLGLFALVVLVARSVGSRAVLSGLALGLAAVAAAALATRLFPGVFGSDDPAIFAALPSNSGRLSYPIGYWNGLAACMGGLIVLLTWFGALATHARIRALATAFIPFPILVIYLASSRGGYAAAAIGVLVLVLLVPRRRSRVLGSAALGAAAGGLVVWIASRQPDLIDGLNTDAAQEAGLVVCGALLAAALAVGWTRMAIESRLDSIRIRRPTPVAIAAIAAVALAAAVVIVDPIERVEEFTAVPTEADPGAAGELIRGSGSGRYQYWESAVDAFASDPVTGIGAGNFELWWNSEGTLERAIRDAHSLYLETLAELGVIGVLLLLAFVGTLAHSVYRGMRDSISTEACAAAALVGAGLLSAGLDWTWELPAVFAIVIVGAALLTSDQGARVRPVSENDSAGGNAAPPARDGFGLGVATIVLAWIGVWAAIVLLVTEVKLDDSRDAATRGDYEAAVQDALDAGAVEPWSPEPPLQEAQVELLRGELDRARIAVQDAIDLAPGDFRPWLVAARIEAAAGNADAYAIAFERANELAPLELPEPEGAPQ